MTRDTCAGVCRLILPNKRVEVLAYGCTSAAATIGEETIFEQLSMRQVRAAGRATRWAPCLSYYYLCWTV